MIVVIAGTPGSGKTTIARELSRLTGWRVISLSHYIKEHDALIGISRQTGTPIVDEKKIENLLRIEIKKGGNIIIETHIPEVLPKEIIDFLFVLHVPIHVLLSRLKKRGWPQRKIDENIMAELESRYVLEMPGAIYIDCDMRPPHEIAMDMFRIIKKNISDTLK